ncbi:Sir2 family NAD-dependent protein deacetylase [Corynebacterium terpenotabidum]|uniref:Sir2 family NAD-dependent protein deacetylase n=1 Tax=Corynebacterium terpenotabidum TaxID=89154 RepID=UPI00041EC323|nr:Sir2 family NAD-dependent protein deacetylase [Corynebacterium terpenotabidum]
MAVPDPVALAHRSALRSIARVVEETGSPTDPVTARRAVTAQLRDGGVLVITGAGVSTESGIPDYRGPHGSLGRHRPMTYQEFRHDPAASHRYWARSFVGWREMATARPNPTHYAIAELEDAGLVTGVVTQNVDGLHAAAGSRSLLALHGDLARVICLQCGHTEDRRHLDARFAAANPGYLEEIRLDPTQVNPDGDVTLDDTHVRRFRMVGCAACGSELLKPDVVYFGEAVPTDRRHRAAQMLEDASSVLVAGSSLAVMSGYRLILDAQKQGKQVSVINGGPGRADDRVDILWRTSVTPAFLGLIDGLSLE